MSTNEPPAGAPGEPTPPPPAATPPPSAGTDPAQSAAPPPPPPPAPAAYPTPPPGAAAPAAGVPHPGALGDRFLARLIDGVILAVIAGILNAIFRSIFLRGFTYSLGEYFLYFLFWGVLTAVLYVGYFAYFESSRGQTVGKQVMKLKTFGPDGVGHPTMEQGVRRNIWLAYPLIFIIPVLGWFLAPLVALGAVILIAVNINADTVNRQHWFDKFAGGTQVMKIG